MSDPVTVVCVEDHPMFRDGLRTLLATTDDLVLVGEAATLAAARQLLAESTPDVILLDLQLPDGSGLDLLATITHPRVLVITMREDEQAISACLEAGARGYLLKDSAPDDLLRGIRAVAAGQSVLGVGVSPALLARARAPVPELLGKLTARERQVLELVARGQGNATIAEALVLSPKTVANTVSAVLLKLSAKDRAQAVALARDAGLGL